MKSRYSYKTGAKAYNCNDRMFRSQVKDTSINYWSEKIDDASYYAVHVERHSLKIRKRKLSGALVGRLRRPKL